MEIKQICPVHHFRYSGKKCPMCENERIANIVRRHSKKSETETNPTEEADKELDWNVLSDKFKLTF